jgi:hypothetical protein
VSPANDTLCYGSSVVLNASGATSYGWSSGGSNASNTVSPTSNTSYTVVGVTNGCTDQKVVNITVVPSPTVSATASPTSVCSGSLITINASGGTTYSWSTGATGATFTDTPTSTTIYVVTGFLGNCGTNASVTILVTPGPTLNVIASSPSICAGTSVNLVATGAISFTWSGNPPGGSLSEAPLTTKIYTVYGLANNGCMGASMITITVNPNPTVTVVSSKPTMCKGEKVTLTASGADSYSWPTTSNTTNTVQVNPASTIIYTVTGTDANGCTGTFVLTQSVSACNGIGQIAASGIGLSVYPNPGAGVFTFVAGKSDAIDISIYSASGQLVFNKSINGSGTIDLTHLASGLYFVNYKLDGKEQQSIRLYKE